MEKSAFHSKKSDNRIFMEQMLRALDRYIRLPFEKVLMIVQLFILVCCTPFEVSGLRRPSPLACAMGHAATFTVNSALVVSQWQQRA